MPLLEETLMSWNTTIFPLLEVFLVLQRQDDMISSNENTSLAYIGDQGQ